MAIAIKENLTFEEMLPFFGIRGKVAVYEGNDTNDFPENKHQTNVIQTDQKWYVRFRFKTYGLLNHLLAGDFVLRVYLEKMGKDEAELPNNTKYVSFVSAPSSYNEIITFQPGDVEEGVYKAVASLTYNGPLGVPGPVAAFAEIGMLQFYKEGPTAP